MLKNLSVIACVLFACGLAHAQCVVHAGSPQTVCPGQQVMLGGAPTVSGGSGIYTYTWGGQAGIANSPNPFVTVTSTTTYTVTVNDGAGCVQSASVTITVINAVVANGGPDVTRCLNSPSFSLPNSGGGVWSGAPGSMLTPAGLFTPNAVGTFNLTLTVISNGCTTTDQVQVIVRPLPVTDAGPDQAICQGQSVQLNATATSANGAITLFTWSGGAVSSPLSPSPTATPASTTTYNVTAVDALGCSSPDQITVIVHPLPTVNAGPPLSLCNDPVPTTLTGFSPAGGTWSGTGVTPAGIFTPPSTGTFTLTYSVTSPIGCTNSSSRVITVVAPGVIDGGGDQQLCVGTPPVTLTPGTPGGTWSGSTHVTPSGVFTPSTVGSYSLVYTIGSGPCISTDQVVVQVLALPVVDAGLDQSICAGQSVQLSATASSSNGAIAVYSWSGGSVASPLQATTAASPGTTTTYNITAADAAGCSNQDQLTVIVNPLPVVSAGNDLTLCSTEPAVQLNGFSPSGGNWSGPGVSSGGLFTPTTAGSFTLTYTVISGAGCVNQATRMVQVSSPQPINPGSSIQVCEGSSTFMLTPVTPGGIWSGTGQVSPAGLFNPSLAGNYVVTYSVDQGVCTASANLPVTVWPLPHVTIAGAGSICAGSTATLSASASGGMGPYSLEWTSGTNAVGSGATLLVSPPITTDYLVTVEDTFGCTSTAVAQVIVISLPQVTAGADQQFCNNPVAEQLTGASPGGGQWSGPNTTSAGLFTPAGLGMFTVSYTYTDAFGCSGSDVKDISVIDGAPVNAGADQEQCILDGDVVLSASTLSPGTWDGPGVVNTATGAVSVNVAGPGVHQYTLTYGTGSCQYADQLTLTIHPMPVLSVGGAQTICAGSGSVSLTGATPSGGLWSGTGILDPNAGLFDSNLTPGSYAVWYTCTDPITGCQSSAEKTVVIAPVPIASFALPAGPVCLGTGVMPVNESVQATVLSWDFGDGSPAQQGDQPSHTYVISGTHTIVLTATNASGCSDQHSQVVTALALPVAEMQLGQTVGCAPLEVTLANLSQGDDLAFLWTLPQGQTSDFEPDPEVLVETNGITTYVITLTASNACSSHTVSQNVLVLPRPTAAFSETIVSTICSPVHVAFSNESLGNPDNYYWDFGNGESSEDSNPDPTIYTTDGQPAQFEIWLVVQNNCGIDSISQLVTVLPNMVTASFELEEDVGCSPMTLALTNTSVGATTYQWQIPGVLNAQEEEPEITLDIPGTYTLYLYATDGCGANTAVASMEVMVSPQAVIASDSWQTCEGVTVQYNALATGSSVVTWLLGDGGEASGPNVSHTYFGENTYEVTLHVEAANSCVATATEYMMVLPRPVALFTSSVNVGCSPVEVCLTNNSSGAQLFQWSLSNGQVTTQPDPCLTLSTTAPQGEVVEIQLDVINEYGCTDATVHQVNINPLPDASFNLVSAGTCELPFALPLEYAMDTGASVTWTLDGGVISSALQTSANLIAVGNYAVGLEVVNAFGCTSSQEAFFEIYPSPVARFEADPEDGCVPHEVQFFNLSEGAMACQWSFGTGAISVLSDPEYTYTQEGIYPVSLTAISSNGCVDTVTEYNYIEVHGLPKPSFVPSTRETSIYVPNVLFHNTSDGAVSYQWSFGGGASSDQEHASHDFIAPGTWPVTLLATSEYGCQQRYTDFIKITSDLMVFVPNAFTPDNDGINDVFLPQMASRDHLKKYEMRIFDRWGTMVFSTADPREPWTGNIRGGGHYAQSDVFLYKITFETTDSSQSQVIEGSVTLLR